MLAVRMLYQWWSRDRLIKDVTQAVSKAVSKVVTKVVTKASNTRAQGD